MNPLNERWDLNYSGSDRKHSDTVRAVCVNWESQSPEKDLENFNVFLQAAGAPFRVVRETQG